MIKIFKKFYKEILIFFSFIILTLIWTYPLIFKIHTSIFGDPKWTFDSRGILRSIWWMKYVWLNKLSFNFDSLVAYPFGFDLSGGNPQPALSYPLLIISLWKNEFFAYNFYVLVSYILSAITMYYLVYYLTRNRVSSTIAGLVYSFAPNHSLLSFAYLGLVAIQWMPLYVLSLLKLSEEKSYKSAIFCALTFSLVTLSAPYYGYFMFIFTIGFIFFKIIYEWDKQEKKMVNRKILRKNFKVILVTISIILITILPFTYSIIKTTLSSSCSGETETSGYARPYSDLYRYSARVSDYFAPSEYHPIFGKIDFWFIKPYAKSSRVWADKTLYLGIMPLFLTFYGIINWKRRKKRKMSDKKTDFIIPFFIFSAFLAFLFSLAPTVKILGTPIPMPSFFMYKIAPMFRYLARFGTVVILCVSVLVGFGVKELLSKIQSKIKQAGVTLFIMGFIVFEFTVIPPFRNLDLSKTPPVYEWLVSQPEDVVIAEYPWLGPTEGRHHEEYLFYQRIHQKRLINGAPMGTFADAVRKEARNIFNPETASLLSYLGAKYVIVHKDAYNSGEIERVNENPGLNFLQSFPEAVVYEVMAETPDLVKVFWEKFAMWERWDDSSLWRWAGNNATIWLCNTRKEDMQIDFGFTVLSFARERTLKIFLNDELIKSVEVLASSDSSLAQQVSFKNLELKSGENIIRFFTPQGETKIDDILHNEDQRKVSFAFSDFKIRRRNESKR